jgi:hypothetical protein
MPVMDAIVALATEDRPRGGKLAIAGGALTVLGPFLSWVTMRNDDFSPSTEIGMALGNGASFIAIGIFIVALGLLAVLRHPRTARVLLGVAGVAVIGLTCWEFFSEVRERVQGTFGLATASVGIGIYTLFAGGLTAAIAGVMLGGEIRRAPANICFAFLTGLAVAAVLATIVVIAFFSPIECPGGCAT